MCGLAHPVPEEVRAVCRPDPSSPVQHPRCLGDTTHSEQKNGYPVKQQKIVIATQGALSHIYRHIVNEIGGASKISR